MDRTLIGVFITAAVALLVLHHARSRHRHHGEARAITSAASASTRGQMNENCFPESLRLRWPMGGAQGKDWVVANYIDHDEGTNRLRDYRGVTGADAITYDGHRGVDIELPSFRAMDGGIPVFAAADGVVEEVFDASPDRNMHCSSDPWNFVKLKHAGGTNTIYGHLKRGSALVRPGTNVVAGTKLALVGSSGCSTFPHLHFEIRDCRGQTVDPVKDALFSDMPEDIRSARPAVMDVLLFQPKIASIIPIQDSRGMDRGLISVHHDFSVGVTVAALKAGDVLSLEFLSPRGENAGVFFERAMNQFLPRSHWWGNFRFELEGTWRLFIKVNGRTLMERSVVATL